MAGEFSRARWLRKAYLVAAVGLFASAGFALCAEQAPRYVWWEGEDYAETNVPDPSQEFPGGNTQQERDKLSGGRWLNPQGPESATPYYVTYRVNVPARAAYNFWVRKFWKHGPFRWRFDSADWATCGRDIALHDDTYLRKFIGANWVFLGEVSLAKGAHELRVEMLDAKGGGCLDCFILIDGPFVPRGKMKPEEVSGRAMPGYFAWEPAGDPLLDTCPIDLRGLNEREAGQDGFLRREGNGFVLGGGEPVRFWMVQGGALVSMRPKMVDYWARRLAKYGVNLVRLGMIGPYEDWKAGNAEGLKDKLDRLHYVISALKKEGIYVYLGHLYWQTHGTISEKDGFPGYGEGKTPLELLFFDPNMQAFYKRWVNALVNAPNPYTGLPISRDPAVAFVEIQNESSLFFWTFKPDSLVPQTLALMEKRFGEWVARKHGSVEKALAAWGPGKPPSRFYPVSQDRPQEGRLGLYGAGHLTGQDWAVSQRNPKRAADQLQFMVEWQKGFYDKMVRDWREDLGIRNLIACSNWKTADPKTLGVLERYTYTAGDVVCRNVYFDVEYDPRPERFYTIDAGDTYTSRSGLKPPAVPEPLTVGHVEDYPYMITENCWCRPNRFRVEWPFLIGTYAAMMGVDGWTFFSLDTALWSTRMAVWEVNSPSILGQFPAAALAFRRGYVKEAPAAVTDRLSFKDLYSFSGSSLYEFSGRDSLWTSRIGDLEGAGDSAASRVDRLAFFVGKVNRILTKEPSRLETADLSDYIDHERKAVRSMTGELEWDYGTGVVTVNAPCAQGACGFLKAAGRIELADVTIESGNEYGAVLIVSLDGKPIRESGAVLVQAGTEDWPYGFRTERVGDKERIAEIGGYPLNVREIDAAVTLAGAGERTAIVLDGNGYPTGEKASAPRADTGLSIRLPKDALYTLVR